jgi:NAD(P)H-hydrate epimerase
MRELDRATIEDHGTPGILLMERAGRGVVRALREALPERANQRVLVVCGKGNNGGDGYVVARELRRRNAQVTVISTTPTAALGGDARTTYQRYLSEGGVVHRLDQGGAAWDRLRREAEDADVIVDALLGPGFHGDLEGDLVDIIEILNASSAFAVSVDVPSGLEADTGQVSLACVLADLTVTFGCAKVGCFVEPGRAHAGRVETVDIGIAAAALDGSEVRFELITEDTASLLVPLRHPTDHKGDCGRVLVIGGSVGMSGAVALAGSAALSAGAGLVTVAAPESLNDALEAQLTEVMTLPLAETGRRGISVRAVDQLLAAAERADAVALGPGMTRDLEPRELVRFLVREIDAPIVLDADGLNAFEGAQDELAAARGRLVLTPHVGEMARLTGTDVRAVESRRLQLPGEVAERTGHVVLLKGSPSVVAAPARPLAIASAGNPGMATAGAGDVLTGIILALIGQGLLPEDAAILGMFVHAEAGDRAARALGIHGMVAGDLLAAVPQAMLGLVRRGEELVFGE